MPIKHGMTRINGVSTPTYVSWQRMKNRCLNPAAIDYPRYGGRGIVICDRWLHSFENFLADMGLRPDGLQLDRIDNEGNYEPTNCRWISKRGNARNRSSNVLLTVDGVTKTATEWGEETGLGETILSRISRGWSHERAVRTPIEARYKPKRQQAPGTSEGLT